MPWFLFALACPIFLSLSNHLDKYLLEKYFGNGGTGTLIIFSSIAGIVMIPFIGIISPSVFNVTPEQICIMMTSGVVTVFAILLYLQAMRRDQASSVVPLFQVIPIFAFILAYIFLGELLTVTQIFGAALVVAGGVALSFELGGKNIVFKKEVFLFMMGSSLLYAIGGLLFKFIALETDFWTTAFWDFVGSAVIGVFFLVCIPRYRKDFIGMLKKNSGTILGLNMTNELLTIVGMLSFQFATLLAPLALVWAVNGFQPFFVLLFGILIASFFPNLSNESLVKTHILYKALVIFVMIIGTFVAHQ